VHAAWAENKAKVLPPGLLIEPVKPLDYFEVGTRGLLLRIHRCVSPLS
jgi:hypothetical protein